MKDHFKQAFGGMERRAGIEPAALAWKARVLPLYERRISS